MYKLISEVEILIAVVQVPSILLTSQGKFSTALSTLIVAACHALVHSTVQLAHTSQKQYLPLLQNADIGAI